MQSLLGYLLTTLSSGSMYTDKEREIQVHLDIQHPLENIFLHKENILSILETFSIPLSILKCDLAYKGELQVDLIWIELRLEHGYLQQSLPNKQGSTETYNQRSRHP